MGNVGSIEITDGDVRCRGMEEQLVGGKCNVSLAWVNNSRSALLQS
jgi:hypothetical protein